jgi:hypothetical protein
MATQEPLDTKAARPGSIERLLPWGIMDEYTGDPFARPGPALVVTATGWLLGVGGAALAIVALRRRRTAVAWGALGGAGGVAVIAAVLLARSTFAAAIVPYEQVCTQPDGSIPVCLHPAYEAVLDDTAAVVAGVMRPLVGVPGAPIRAEQAVAGTVGGQPDGIFGIFPAESSSPDDRAMMAFDIAGSLAHGPSWYAEIDRTFEAAPREAQDAIALWLLRQAGWEDELARLEHSPEPFVVDESDAGHQARPARVVAAADRFAALPPEQQRAWLEANFAPLRAGELTLEDLP